MGKSDITENVEKDNRDKKSGMVLFVDPAGDQKYIKLSHATRIVAEYPDTNDPRYKYDYYEDS